MTYQDRNLSIVIPTYSAAAELAVCLDSLRKNSRLDNEILIYVDRLDGVEAHPEVIKVLEARGLPYVVNAERRGPYGSWNEGAKAGRNDLLCFITDDQYFAPSWDINIVRKMDDYDLLTGQFVEAGIITPYHTNIARNFGTTASTFDEEGFLEFVDRLSEDRVAYDGFYSPTVIKRELFERLGGWPNKKPFPHPNDWLFRLKLNDAGYEYRRACDSFSYHFQSASSDSPRPTTMHFERPDPPRRPETRRETLVRKAKGSPRWLLRRLNFAPPYRSKVSGYAWPKKADQALVYEFCVGRGVEVGAGSNRVANIYTVAVDMKGEFKGRIYPRPDIEGQAYDLSAFEDETRDFVLNAHTLEHLIDPIKALEEWKRVLKPGGILYTILPDKSLIPHRVDNEAAPTSLSELNDRHKNQILETVDDNPETSCLGTLEDATFDPNGVPGMRHFNYWTPADVVPLMEHVGFTVERVVTAEDKDIGLDRPGTAFDDFTIVARRP